MRYMSQLDGLRALAVSLVLLSHFWTYPAGYPLLNHLASAGWVGVDLFFVLSGYLITRILVESRDNPRYFRDFYARRSLRIFPPYFALLAVVLIALPRVSHSQALDTVRGDAWMYMLYLANVAIASGGWALFATDITWSLSVEEQFYLVWPALVRATRDLVPICLGLIVLLPLIRTALWLTGVDWVWLYTMMPLRADAFAMGAILTVLHHHKLLGSRRLLPLTLGLSALLLGLIATGRFLRESMLVNTFGFTLTGLCAACLIACALERRAFANLLSWQPVAYMGRVSYGVYLYHPLCLMGASLVLPQLPGVTGGMVQFAGVSALTVCVASASYHLYERPFLKLKDRFTAGNALAPFRRVERSDAEPVGE